MGPRLRARRGHGARRHGRRPRWAALLPAPGARGEPPHKNPPGFRGCV
uniref:Uncharacterized protein n=1 Tax=Arundo donax TaxID=35708 RepID=A0A0A9BXT8_ARUDO